MNESHTLTVTGFVRDDGACGLYRISQPLTLAEESGYLNKRLVWVNEPPEDTLKKLDGAHVVVIPRPYDEVMLDLMGRLKKHDIKVVIDFDDDLFTISPWSNHYAEFGTEEVSVNLDGEVKPLWVDGKNIDLKLNRLRLEGFKRALDIADMVTVTQPVLAKAYRPYNDNIVCLPNCIDSRNWRKLPLKERDTVRLLWSGGSSHYQDVYILKNVLPVICKKYPEVQVVVMGCCWKAIFGSIPPEQFEYHDWVSISAYPYKHAILDIDISLIPLDMVPFNYGKSNLKLLEQAFLQVTSIASMTTPYREFYAGNNMVMVSNDDQSWTEAISRLVEDAALRKEMGRNAYKCAMEQYDALPQSKQWADAYMKVATS